MDERRKAKRRLAYLVAEPHFFGGYRAQTS